MQHKSRPVGWGGVRLPVLLAPWLGVLICACGGSDPGAPAPAGGAEGEGAIPDAEGEMSDASPESMLQLAIDGRDEELGAQARLEIQEGIDSVHLAISGADRENDFVLLDIQFPDVGSTMGAHVIELGLPDRVENHANVTLDGLLYYSQGGQVELTLSEDGAIQGDFELSLALDETPPGSVPSELQPSDDATALSGAFSGTWILSCHSRLPGHGTLLPGGEFCENLDF